MNTYIKEIYSSIKLCLDSYKYQFSSTPLRMQRQVYAIPPALEYKFRVCGSIRVAVPVCIPVPVPVCI